MGNDAGAASVRTLTIQDLNSIVALHPSAFPDSLLTVLGKGTIRSYYKWLLLGPHDVTALGVEDQGNLRGFCLAGTFRGALSGFLAMNRFRLAYGLLLHPWVLANPRHRRRVVQGVRTLLGVPACQPKAAYVPPKAFSILAIAVDPSCVRMGYGRLLMDACEHIAVERSFSRLCLTVDPKNTGAISFYESLGWLKLVEQGQWSHEMFKTQLLSPDSGPKSRAASS